MRASLRCAEDAARLVSEIGFLPLFAGPVPGFSVEELTPGQWWTGLADDPWGWREALAGRGDVLYGKFFEGHAGFVSREWFPTLINLRRDGYDFDSRWEEGLATPLCHSIMLEVEKEPGLLKSELKKRAGGKGFEGAVTLLQEQTYLLICGFDRRRNRFGEPYGWHIARLTTPEAAFGAEWATQMYAEAPEASRARIEAHLHTLLPKAEPEALRRLIG